MPSAGQAARDQRREDKAKQRAAALAAKQQRAAAEAEAYRAHTRLLNRAAGISTVKLVCHEDSWNAIAGYCSRRQDWPRVAQRAIERSPEGIVTVTLSGRQVAVVLDVCRDLTRPKSWAYDTIKAVARRIHDVAAQVVSQVDPDAPRGTPVPPIVIDDQIGAAEPDQS